MGIAERGVDSKRRAEGLGNGGPDAARGRGTITRTMGHRLTARTVLPGEEEDYRALREALSAEWAPRGETETILVRRMTDCAWRLLRCGAIEAELLETLRAGEAYGAGPESGLALGFIAEDAEGGALERLARYETALDRAYHRALRTLHLLQTPRRTAGGRAYGGGNDGGRAEPPPPRPFWNEPPRAAQALELPARGDQDDDAPVEVEEVLLDGDDGGPRAEDGGAGPGQDACSGAAQAEPCVEGDEDEGCEHQERGRTRADARGAGRPKADRLRNGPDGRAERTGADLAVRDWPGEPDHVPLAPGREPVSRVIGGPLSRFAGPGWLE